MKMVGQFFSNWWGKMRPYYAKVHQEMWVGLALTTYVYYKISYGGKKAVKDKPAH